LAEVILDKVTKTFGGVTALKELSLSARDGEFLVFVGPSGCGKTTALRLIAGLEDLTSGEIYIGGNKVNDVPPRERDIAMVFQSYALYPHMSVEENMSFGLRLRKTPSSEIDKRVKFAADILGIKDLLKRRPRQLSGGQRQRVALARAIVREPKVFLMDEPLSNLDAKLRVQTRAELAKLHQRLQTTVIYVTHDQVEAMTMGQRIAVMKGGVLQQLDTPECLYGRPSNVFVAGFIGSPSMNIFSASVRTEGDLVYVERPGLCLRVPPGKAEPLRPYASKDILFGIRPENMSDRRLSAPCEDESCLLARVEVVENMGHEKFVHLTAGDRTLVARVDPRTAVTPGDEISVAVAMHKMHAFDPMTEQAVGAGDSSSPFTL